MRQLITVRDTDRLFFECLSLALELGEMGAPEIQVVSVPAQDGQGFGVWISDKIHDEKHSVSATAMASSGEVSASDNRWRG
jgi:hypothetical protein